MVNKFRELRRRRKRKYEARKLKRQEGLLNAKKEALRKLEDRGILPTWVKKKKFSADREPTAYEKARYKA
jgi:hypothetical protein